MKYGTSADCTQSVVNTVRTPPSVVQCVDVLEERTISCCLVTVDTSAFNALNPMDSYGIKPVSFREPRPALFVKQYSMPPVLDRESYRQAVLQWRLPTMQLQPQE